MCDAIRTLGLHVSAQDYKRIRIAECESISNQMQIPTAK